jgi:hypothetical protein
LQGVQCGDRSIPGKGCLTREYQAGELIGVIDARVEVGKISQRVKVVIPECGIVHPVILVIYTADTYLQAVFSEVDVVLPPPAPAYSSLPDFKRGAMQAVYLERGDMAVVDRLASIFLLE